VQTEESWIHVLASDGTRVDTDDSAFLHLDQHLVGEASADAARGDGLPSW
jgi:hypothetical protein